MNLSWLFSHEVDERIPINPLTVLLFALTLAFLFHANPITTVAKLVEKVTGRILWISAKLGVNTATGVILTTYERDVINKAGFNPGEGDFIDKELKLQMKYIDNLQMDFGVNSKAFPHLTKLESLTTLSVDAQNKIGKWGVRGLSVMNLFLNYVPLSKELVTVLMDPEHLAAIPCILTVRIQLLKKLMAMLGNRIVKGDRKEAKGTKTSDGTKMEEVISPGTDLLQLLEDFFSNPTKENPVAKPFLSLIPSSKTLFSPVDENLYRGGTLDEDEEHQVISIISETIFRTLQANSRHPENKQLEFKVGKTTVTTELQFIQAMRKQGWNVRAWIFTRSADFLNLAAKDNDTFTPMAVPVQFRVSVDSIPLPTDEVLNPKGQQLPPDLTGKVSSDDLDELDAARPFLVFAVPHAEWIYEIWKDGSGREDIDVHPVAGYTSNATADVNLLKNRKQGRGKRIGVRWFHDIGEGINWFPYQLWSTHWSSWTGGRKLREVEGDDVEKVLTACVNYRNGVDRLDLGKRNGYGLVGVCLDSVGQVERLVFNQETVFPVFGNEETRKLAQEKAMSLKNYPEMLDDAQIADQILQRIQRHEQTGETQADWLQRAGSCWPFQRGKEPLEVLKLTRLYLEQVGVISKQDPSNLYPERP